MTICFFFSAPSVRQGLLIAGLLLVCLAALAVAAACVWRLWLSSACCAEAEGDTKGDTKPPAADGDQVEVEAEKTVEL